MRLLVSLRVADEVAAALAGGADIIDAKEPERGSLGPVTPETMNAIAARVPSNVPFSAALGDLRTADAARDAVTHAHVLPRLAPVYLKFGFAGESSVAGMRVLIAAAVEAASRAPAHPVVVPVAYADWLDAGSPSPESVLDAALSVGARAFLLDTYIKDGSGLLDRLEIGRVRALAARARTAGMLVALAGSLDLAAIDRLAGVADVIGVRGAACIGGRNGRVDPWLVRRLRDHLTPPARLLSAAG
jgi:(5-formylfuran-3-yl)methyl phosphate synthase